MIISLPYHKILTPFKIKKISFIQKSYLRDSYVRIKNQFLLSVSQMEKISNLMISNSNHLKELHFFLPLSINFKIDQHLKSELILDQNQNHWGSGSFDYRPDYREEQTELLRKHFFNTISSCKRIEVLTSNILPISLTNLKNLKQLRLQIYSSEYGEFKNQLKVLFNANIQILNSYFSTEQPNLELLHLYRHKGINNWNSKDIEFGDNELLVLTNLKNSISKSCRNLKNFQDRFLFGFPSYSEKFIDFITQIPKSVILIYNGLAEEQHAKQRRGINDWVNEDENSNREYTLEFPMEYYFHKIDYFCKVLESRCNEEKELSIFRKKKKWDFVIDFGVSLGSLIDRSTWNKVELWDGNYGKFIRTIMKKFYGSKCYMKIGCAGNNMTHPCPESMITFSKLFEEDDTLNCPFVCEELGIDIYFSHCYENWKVQRKEEEETEEEKEKEKEKVCEEKIKIIAKAKKNLTRVLMKNKNLKEMNLNLIYRTLMRGYSDFAGEVYLSSILDAMDVSSSCIEVIKLSVSVFGELDLDHFNEIRLLFENSWIPKIIQIIEKKRKMGKLSSLEKLDIFFSIGHGEEFPISSNGDIDKEKMEQERKRRELNEIMTNYLIKDVKELFDEEFVRKLGEDIKKDWKSVGISLFCRGQRTMFIFEEFCDVNSVFEVKRNQN